MFGYLSVSAFEAVSIGKVLAFMLPAVDRMPLYEIAGSTVYGAHLLLALVFTAFITAINYLGVAIATRVQILLTLLLLTATTVFVVAGVANGEFANLSSEAGTASSFNVSGLLAVFVTAPFWFVGFDIIPQAAEERKDRSPIKRLGLYVSLAIIGSTIFYCAVMLSAGMTVPWQSLIAADLPTARAFESAFASPILVNLVLTAGLIGLLTSWNGFFLAGSRVLFALGRGRIIHATFGTTHRRYQTPNKAILFSGGVTFAAALLGHGAMLAFVNVGSFCIAMAFFGVTLSFFKLRRDFPDMARPYKMSLARVWGRVALVGSLFILLVMVFPGSPGMLAWPFEWLILTVLSLLGLCFWIAGRRERSQVSETEQARLVLGDYA